MSVLAVQALLRLKYHPGFAAAPAIGSPGYALPRINETLVIPVEEASLPLLREHGIRVEGQAGEGSVIVMDAAMPQLDLLCRFDGHADCAAVLGLGEAFGGELVFAGPHGIVVSAGFGAAGPPSRISVTVDAFCAAYFGEGVTSVDSHWHIDGDQTTPGSLLVGDDALIAQGVRCRNYDGHAIVDIESLAVVNAPGRVILGPHCCLGEGVLIARALRIGAGSVIDHGSVVSADIPGCVAAGGVPARVLRERVTWDRRRKPSAEQIRAQIQAQIQAMLATG
jgi:acetyltransferase-like isoleucine patch superfamily enzyme